MKKREKSENAKIQQNTLNKNTFRWLWEFTKGKRGTYLLSVILALLGVASMLLVYVCLASLIRELITGGHDIGFYIQRCVQIGLLWVIRYAFHGFSTYSAHASTFGLIGNARKKLLKKLNTMPLGAVQMRSSGEYKSIICDRADQIEPTLAHVVPEFTANIVGAIVMFIYMMTIDWRVGLWQLICIPVGIVAFALMMSSTPKYYPNTIAKTKALNATAVEYIGGIEVIKAFGQSKTSYGKFVKAAKEGADCFIEWMRSQNFLQNLGMACFPATLLGLLPAGVHYCLDGSLAPADLILLIILSLGTIAPLITVFGYVDDIAKVGEIISDMADVMEEKDMIRPKEGDVKPKSHDIIIKDVHFSYKDKEVLHGVNLEIKDKTVNALVGPSGSGKSTIARLIASLWDVDSGEITIGGVNIKDMALEEYNKHVSYVSQENYLFDQSVMDNIRMGKDDATDEEVVEAAKRCGCHEFIMSLEKGYQTICGGSGGHLSGGERQRISIARAMLKDAPIVILDEATSYTDPESEAVIQNALSKLTVGKTLIVIAHRLSTIVDADRIFLINDGNVENYGTQEEMLSSSALYKSMWESHMALKKGGN
ncbi:MAG: ABC transporter ATP-binding protein/permease [Parasporobacterium sp.]|nr:ABC transporter ATP-binding protein/permease [Parasporobacterium sp.]